MIRRAQTARHKQSQSLAVAADDLGFVREGDENSIEEQLRSDLASAKQDIVKLKSHIENLQKVLKERPPSEEVQALKKELQDLELLLHGTQKENEKALSELAKVREREKLMERELRRLIGDDWEDTLSIGGRYSPSRPVPSTTSSVPRHMTSNDNSAVVSSGTNTSGQTNVALLAYVEQIRTMLTGMDERLQLGEKNVQAAIDRAEIEKQQLYDILNQEESDPVPS